MSVLHRLQQYFSYITGTSHNIHVFSRFQQYKAGPLNCLYQGHSNEKSRRIQCGSNPGHLGYIKNFTTAQRMIQIFNDYKKQSLVFTAHQKKAFENIVEKGENAGKQHFLLFPQCFLPCLRQKSSFK